MDEKTKGRLMAAQRDEPCAIVVTALPLEARAVTSFLEAAQEQRHPQGSAYTVGCLVTAAGAWRVAVVLTGPGNTGAAQATERAINHFRPVAAFFVGVGGGRKDARIGDVVVADKVYGYESARDTAQGLVPRPEVQVPSYRLLQQALVESNRAQWLARLGDGGPGAPPSVLIKPIASGEKLVTSRQAEVGSLLSRSYDDAVAVDMESHGFLKAVHANPGVDALVVRGISDLLDNKSRSSDADDQVAAARNAAAFAFELLNSYARPSRESDGESAFEVRLPAFELCARFQGPGDGGLEAWWQAFRRRVQAGAAPPEGTAPDEKRSRFSLDVSGSREGRLTVEAVLEKARGSGESGHEDVRPLQLLLELEPTEAERALVEEVLAIGDAAARGIFAGAIKTLVRLGSKEALSNRLRNEFLMEAARLDFFFEAEQAHAITSSALKLQVLEPALLNAVMHCLFAASLRMRTRGAHTAAALLDRLFVELTARAVAQGSGGAEIVYSAARTIPEPGYALSVFQGLLGLQPAYEARWYWQRDVGSKLYSLGHHLDAARHYDQAAALKPEYSKLYRYAGDAYYYAGAWAEAMQRFEKAISLEPAEWYFVKPKLEYCKAQVSRGIPQASLFKKRRRFADWLTTLGVRMEALSVPLLPALLFRLSLSVCALTREAGVHLAWNANRKGHYKAAEHWLWYALLCRPEVPQPWLNAAVNAVFQEGGVWTERSRLYAKAAIFHGGPEAVERLRVNLINTRNQEALVAEFQVIFEEVRRERDAWLERQRRLTAPEDFGGAIHLEIDDLG